MPIARILTRGFGNGTFSGVAGEIVTAGFAIGEAIIDVAVRDRSAVRFGPERRLVLLTHEDRSIIMPRENASIKL